MSNDKLKIAEKKLIKMLGEPIPDYISAIGHGMIGNNECLYVYLTRKIDIGIGNVDGIPIVTKITGKIKPL